MSEPLKPTPLDPVEVSRDAAALFRQWKANGGSLDDLALMVCSGLAVAQIGGRWRAKKFAEIDERIQSGLFVDRDIWQANTDYKSGDWVTYGGSMWKAQRANLNERPGTSPAWRLRIKRGKDSRGLDAHTAAGPAR